MKKLYKQKDEDVKELRKMHYSMVLWKNRGASTDPFKSVTHNYYMPLMHFQKRGKSPGSSKQINKKN